MANYGFTNTVPCISDTKIMLSENNNVNKSSSNN